VPHFPRVFHAAADAAAAEEQVEVIVKYSGDIRAVAKELGGAAEVLLQNYAILTLPRGNIPALYAYTQVENLELPKNLYIVSAYNLIASCVRSVQDQKAYGLTGKDVIVAVIDSGIDYTHPDFRNADGSSRILYLWDQTAEGTPPEGFTAGAEYSQAQLTEALHSSAPLSAVPSVDLSGHGTAVAGIAAGNGRESGGENVGVAPEADLIAVKVGRKGFRSFAQTSELMRAVEYVIARARQLRKPLAVNISFGMNNGSHLGDSLFETYLSAISAEWKTVIVTPTGNEGAAGHHYAGRVSSGRETEIEFFTASGIETFYLSLWKNFVDSFAVELIFPGGMSSGVVGIENQTRTVRAGNLSLTILYGQPSRYSVGQEIYFSVTALTGTIAPGVWRLRLIASTVVDGAFEMWLPTLEAVTAKTYFSGAAAERTMTIPSTALRVIRVAGYNDRIGNIAEFSGLGSPNRALPNPDLAAPAVGILTTKSGGGYDAFTGTSMAAPFVTGSAALMMQWGIVNRNAPFLYGERIRAFLRLGANRASALSYPNPAFGYGTLCLNSTMSYLERYQWGGDSIWLRT